MADLELALQEVHREGKSVTLGRHRVFRFRTSTPAHVFESLVMQFDDRRLVELTSRDGFDERLAVFLLDEVADLKLPAISSTTIQVAAATFPKPWSFDAVVIVPPSVANRFEHQSPVLRRVTYWVVPAFDGEFADGADGVEFWHQLGRKDGWRSVVVQWDRSKKTQPVYDV